MQRGRVRVFIATSIDGFIAGPGGDLSWLSPPTSDPPSGEPPSDNGFSAFMADIGASLMGRITYEMVLGFGITPSSNPLLVASSRPVVSEHASVRGVAGDIAGMIEQAHAGANGRDVSLDGGTLIRQASDAGLIDEMTLTIVPVVLGAGTPLFAGAEQRRRFELESAQVLGAGLVQLRYRRA